MAVVILLLLHRASNSRAIVDWPSTTLAQRPNPSTEFRVVVSRVLTARFGPVTSAMKTTATLRIPLPFRDSCKLSSTAATLHDLLRKTHKNTSKCVPHEASGTSWLE